MISNTQDCCTSNVLIAAKDCAENPKRRYGLLQDPSALWCQIRAPSTVNHNSKDSPLRTPRKSGRGASLFLDDHGACEGCNCPTLARLCLASRTTSLPSSEPTIFMVGHSQQHPTCPTQFNQKLVLRFGLQPRPCFRRHIFQQNVCVEPY